MGRDEHDLTRTRVEDGKVLAARRFFAVRPVEAGELFGTNREESPAAWLACHQPVVRALRVLEDERLASSIIRRRAAADAEEGERLVPMTCVLVALEDLLRRELVRQRGVVRQT